MVKSRLCQRCWHSYKTIRSPCRGQGEQNHCSTIWHRSWSSSIWGIHSHTATDTPWLWCQGHKWFIGRRN